MCLGAWSILEKKFFLYFLLIVGWIIVAHGVRSSTAYGNFPDQELSVPCLLHWQVNTLPLSHHGSRGNNLEGTLYNGKCFCLLNWKLHIFSPQRFSSFALQSPTGTRWCQIKSKVSVVKHQKTSWDCVTKHWMFTRALSLLHSFLCCTHIFYSIWCWRWYKLLLIYFTRQINCYLLSIACDMFTLA